MHIKDVEQRTGLSRANIRYYEQEGLVHPARRKNGYRDYSPDDLETLLRVRLLRRLDVPIEEIRAMQAGKLSLSEALSQRLAALRRREEQARADQSVCRAMQADHACYDTLDAENTGGFCTRRPRRPLPQPGRTVRIPAPGGGSWPGGWICFCAPPPWPWR